MGAPYKGCNAEIELSPIGGGGPFAVSFSNSWSINFSKPSRDFKPLGAFRPKRGVKGSEWTISLSGFFDYFDDGQALLSPGQEVLISIFPSGQGASRPEYSGTVFVESADTSGSVDDLIPFSSTLIGASDLSGSETWLGD